MVSGYRGTARVGVSLSSGLRGWPPQWLTGRHNLRAAARLRLQPFGPLFAQVFAARNALVSIVHRLFGQRRQGIGLPGRDSGQKRRHFRLREAQEHFVHIARAADEVVHLRWTV